MLADEKKRLIQESLQALAASHAAAVAQIEKTMIALVEELGPEPDREERGRDAGSSECPTANVTTFCITWRGKTCFLGNNLLFWLFRRLLQSSGLYVSHLDLLDDVWRGQRQSSTVRGVAKRLRDRLIDADMADLAAAIDGSVSGHYGLMLV